jgi:hypothetical protein
MSKETTKPPRCEHLESAVYWRNGRCYHVVDDTSCYGHFGKIMQLLPAPATIVATFDGGEDLPIFAIALLEYCDGLQIVSPVVAGDLSDFAPAHRYQNFIGIRVVDEKVDT